MPIEPGGRDPTVHAHVGVVAEPTVVGSVTVVFASTVIGMGQLAVTGVCRAVISTVHWFFVPRVSVASKVTACTPGRSAK